MLLELSIRNFAIIEDLNIEFSKGLNILTGETGSGKSILIEALGVVLGSRTNKDFVQTGYEKSSLEAVFYIEDNEKIKEILAKYSIDFSDDNILVIGKEINVKGPSISRVNGKIVNLSMLKEITEKLIDIFGQHEHQSLLDTSKHIDILDGFLANEDLELKEKIQKLYEDLKVQEVKLKNISIDKQGLDREIDILKFQIDEIEMANLKVEDENIFDEYKKLFNMKDIMYSFLKLIDNFSTEDFEKNSVIDLLNINLVELRKIYDKDKEIKEYYTRLEACLLDITELNRDMQSYYEGLNLDEERLVYLEDRISLISKLKNKYGRDTEEILLFRDQAKLRLSLLENQEHEKEIINLEISKIKSDLEDLSSILSTERKKIALSLESRIKQELIELNMTKVDFKIDFRKMDSYQLNGFDQVEFLISTNLGEELKPLSKIASGGEMSRIMLGFKSILAYSDNIPTMIFDEIDTGISGRTAQVVGEKIYEISKDHQVICISHLPQITALGDSHYLIDKEEIDRRTISSIRKLDFEERVEEMARLIGGIDLTETTLKHAREMLNMSDNFKKTL